MKLGNKFPERCVAKFKNTLEKVDWDGTIKKQTVMVRCTDVRDRECPLCPRHQKTHSHLLTSGGYRIAS